MKLGNIFLTTFLLFHTERVAMGTCRVTEEAMDLIKKYEAFVPKGYIDSGGGWWAVGYGSNGKGINKYTVWTEAQATRRLRIDLHFTGLALCRALRARGVDPTIHQFNALLSLAYNAGLGAAISPKLVGYLRQGKVLRASNRILLYVKSRGKVLPGLVLRRKAERDMFLRQDTDFELSIYRRSY